MLGRRRLSHLCRVREAFRPMGGNIGGAHIEIDRSRSLSRRVRRLSSVILLVVVIVAAGGRELIGHSLHDVLVHCRTLGRRGGLRLRSG